MVIGIEKIFLYQLPLPSNNDNGNGNGNGNVMGLSGKRC